MIQSFAPLFTVAVKHSYYAGNCEDLEFFVPSSTAGTMQGGKVLARILAGRLHVLFEADETGVPVNSLAGQTLLLGLRLTNRSFSNFTNPVVSDARLTPFYSNGHDPTKLGPPQEVILTSGVHAYSPRSATRPLTLRLVDRLDKLFASQTLPPGAAEGSFDLRALPEGQYWIDEVPGSAGDPDTHLFVSTELRNAGAWGLLAIEIDAGFYAAPPEFTLEFSARQEQLKYFVVAKNFTPFEFDQLNVTDSGFNDGDPLQLKFDKVLPGSFTPTDISPALLGGADKKVVMFRSQAAVVRGEQGRRKIQLTRNGEIQISHLPQPAADRAQSHFIIHLAKPNP